MKTVTASALLSAIALVAGCAGYSGSGPSAEAKLKPTAGNTSSGVVHFQQNGNRVTVRASIEGLTPGVHGFHIHEKGDCSAPDATSAGGHFNPGAKQHGAPTSVDHHGGDFGNLTADANGRASLTLVVANGEITLDRDVANSIIGKGVIVHADPDDYKTQPTGNAGKRVACGVIARN